MTPLKERARRVLVLAALFGSSAAAGAACVVPADSFVLAYDVYHETDTLPEGGGSAASVINAHFAKAETLFTANGLPISLVDGSRPSSTLLTGNQSQSVKSLINAMVGPDLDSAIASFKTAAEAGGFYAKERLNVYYVNVKDLRGVHFRMRDGMPHNIIVMGLGFNSDTLAHELGHAFSLGHVNFWSHDDPEMDVFPNGIQVEYCVEHGYWDGDCDLPAGQERENLLWAASEERKSITAGQLFRAACNGNSIIITNGDHPDSPEAVWCPDWSAAGGCPELF